MNNEQDAIDPTSEQQVLAVLDSQAVVTDKTEVMPGAVRPANGWQKMLTLIPPQVGLL